MLGGLITLSQYPAFPNDRKMTSRNSQESERTMRPLTHRPTLARRIWPWTVAIAVAFSTGGHAAYAGIVGQWDFTNGWNSSNGLITPVSGVSGLSLAYLPKTPYYQHPQAQSGSNPPPLQFATTGSFGIANLGSGGDTVVMQMPDMRGYGLITGLMARFPQMVNGDGTATKLNRYSVVMDVYIPAATDATQPPNYLTLLQTRIGADNAWFIDKRTDATGVASSYGGTVTPDAWHRLALVMNLSDSGTVSQYRTYVNGGLAADIVPNLVPLTSQRNNDLVTRDLYTNGVFSIGTLNDSLNGLGTDSAFYLFNADRNDATDGPTQGELGTLYVANLQFRDDAMTMPRSRPLAAPRPARSRCRSRRRSACWLRPVRPRSRHGYRAAGSSRPPAAARQLGWPAVWGRPRRRPPPPRHPSPVRPPAVRSPTTFVRRMPRPNGRGLRAATSVPAGSSRPSS